MARAYTVRAAGDQVLVAVDSTRAMLGHAGYEPAILEAGDQRTLPIGDGLEVQIIVRERTD